MPGKTGFIGLGHLGAAMAKRLIGEGVVVGERAGINKGKVLDILAAGAGNSGVMNAKKERIFNEDYSTHFSASLIYKDLHYLQDLARSLGMPLLASSAIKEIFALTFKEGKEGLDMSVVYDVLGRI